jgi:hypothetical protein
VDPTFWSCYAVMAALVLAAVWVAARHPRHWRVSLLLAIAVLIVHARLYWRFTVDDSFITYRVARNWAAGLGPVYQAGERVEGTTGLAWPALLALAIRLGLPVDVAAKVIGLLCSALAMVAVALLARRLLGDARAALAAPFALALHPLWAAWSCAGMETPLFAGGLAWAAWALVAGKRLFRIVPLDAVLFGILTWVRPEGLLFGALAFGWTAVREARQGGAPRSRALAWGLGFAALAAPYTIACWSYYGALLPNTYFAKMVPAAVRLPAGLKSLGDFLTYSGLAFVALLILALPRLRSAPAAAGFVALAVAGLAADVVWVGGDVLHLRFFVHVLPLLAVLVALGIDELATGFAVSRAVPGIAAAVAVAGALALAWVHASAQLDRRALEARDQFGAAYAVRNPRNVEEVAAPLGLWLHDHAPPGARLATWDIGAIGYFSGLHVIDLYGLTDRRLARMNHEGTPPSQRMAYFESLDPELLVTYVSADGPVLAWMSSGRDWLKGRYRPHSIWRATSSGYALTLLVRDDVHLADPPPQAALAALTR